ncbi:MAG: flagellar brake protein [Gammaproteobacteria bacterium]|nr:flagellar brake protein [Gammaproteobacteria bacterium]
MVKIVRSLPYDDQPDSELITDPSRIARLLENLSKHYSPLTLQIPGYKKHYASCIVGVEKPYVLLDELMPNTGHEHLLEVGKVKARGKIDGVDIKFSTTLSRVDVQKNITTYYMRLPTKLNYQQRRVAYRVRIPLSKTLHILIDNGSNRPTVAELHDLSHGGAGKIIPEGKNIFKVGEYYECVIELPCGEWLICTVQVRYMKDIPSKKRQMIGTQFIDLLPVQKRLISRSISQLELEEIKKRAVLR